jgi:hypothetical protein
MVLQGDGAVMCRALSPSALGFHYTVFMHRSLRIVELLHASHVW